MTAATMAAPSIARPRFYLWMATVVVLIAFGGFIPTYWARVATGSFGGQPIMHLHGLLFFAWTLLFFSQTALVAAGRIPDHRAWGMVGIFLVGMMAISVPLASINSMWAADRLGGPAMGDMARRFSVVPMTALPVILGFFGFAIANVRRPEWHKRLMLMMQIPLLEAAAGRITPYVLFPGGPPAGPPPGAFAAIPGGLAVDLLIVAGMIYDRRTLGKVHTAYKIGLPIILATQFLAVPISMTDGWLGFAAWLQHLVR